MQHPNTVAVEWAKNLELFSRAISRALLSIFSCKIWCSTIDFLVQFLVLYFRFSRAISRTLLSIFSCKKLVLSFRFSRAVSRALLSIFSCNFSCPTFDFLVQFLVRLLQRISRQKKMKHKKTKKTVPVCTWLFSKQIQNQLKITTSHFVSGQFFNSALYVSCGGRCM